MIDTQYLKLPSAALRFLLALTLGGFATSSLAGGDIREFRTCHNEFLSLQKSKDQLQADIEYMNRDKSLLELEAGSINATRGSLAWTPEESSGFLKLQLNEQVNKYNEHVYKRNAELGGIQSAQRRIASMARVFESRCAQDFENTEDSEMERECSDSDDEFCNSIVRALHSDD